MIDEPEGDEPEAPDTPQPDPAVEAEARKYGWKPQDEFTLKPEGWQDAARFLESPKTQVKILRDELKAVKQHASGLENTTKFVVERTKAQERERFEREMAELREQKRAAAESADMDRYKALETREAAVKPPAYEAPAPNVDPYVSEYVANNAWAKDQQLVDFAARAIDNDPNARLLDARGQMAFAERKVREYFPDRFQDQPALAGAPARSRVDGGGLATGARRGKTIADLPADAQQAFQTFKKQGLPITEKEYVAQYLGEA